MSHETKEASGKRVFVFYALLVSCVVAVFAITALMMHLFAMPSHAIAAPHPPEPALQVTPAADLAAHRAAETAQENVYGWVDPDKGIVRIPIRQAMDRMVTRGLDDTNAQVAH